MQSNSNDWGRGMVELNKMHLGKPCCQDKGWPDSKVSFMVWPKALCQGYRCALWE